MGPRRLSNNKGRLDGAGLFLMLTRSASIEEVLVDFTKVAAEKGIRLYSVSFKRERLERELKLPNDGAGAGTGGRSVRNFVRPRRFIAGRTN